MAWEPFFTLQTEFVLKANADANSAMHREAALAHYIYTMYKHSASRDAKFFYHCVRPCTYKSLDMTRDIMIFRSKCWRARILAQEIAEYEAIINHMIEPIINKDQETI